jgi:hydroxymethylpyrimidine pyrophosphatase-like HAD family hydrolase
MVEKLIAHLNIKGEVLTLGNHMNDLELLQVADIGVAVANATEELKKFADYVTKGEYEKGVMESIEKFIIKTHISHSFSI